MTVRLMIRAPLPEPTESLLGYLHRVADANGYPDAKTLLGLIDCAYGRPLIEGLDRLEACLGLPVGCLRPIAPEVSPARPVLNRRFERHHAHPICPACLAEGWVHADGWRHCFVTACAHHGTLLQDTCPRCRELVSPRYGGWRACGCGHPLQEFPRETANPMEIALSALICELPHPTRGPLPSPWETDSPGDIGRFIYFLGSRARTPVSGKPGKARLPSTVAQSQTFLAPVFSLLDDWPANLDVEIRRRLVDGDPNAQTAPARLGEWYQTLVRFRGPSYRPFLERLAAVIAAEFDGPYKGTAYGRSLPAAWMSAAEAAREIGIRAERIVAAISSGAIEGRLHRSGLSHQHHLVSRDAVAQVRHDRKRFLNATSAASRLGVSKPQFRLILEAGVIDNRSQDDRPPLVDGGFEGSVLDELVADVRARTRPGEGPEIAFRDINLRKTTDRGPLLELFRDVFEGRLPPVSWHGERLGDLRFPLDAIEGRLRSLRAGEDWTIQQAAEITGWKQQCIAAWCRQGLIQSAQLSHGPRVGRLIRPHHVVAFQATFVPVAQLAKESGRAPRALLKEFAKRRIAVVGDFGDGPARRGHLIRIADLLLTSEA